MADDSQNNLGSLKTRNFPFFEFSAMLLHTQKEEGQEFVSRLEVSSNLYDSWCTHTHQLEARRGLGRSSQN